MEQIKIGKRVAITGIEWREAPDGALSQKKLARISSRKNYPLRGAVLLEDAERNRHVGIWRAEKTPPRGAVSLAASVAKGHPDGVFVLRLDATTVWLMIAAQGAVIPGTDITGTLEDVNIALRRYVELFDDLDLYVSDEGLVRDQLDDEIHPVEGIRQWLEQAENVDLDSLVVEEDWVEIQPMADQARAQKRLLLALGSVVVAGFLGNYLWKQMQADPAPLRPVAQPERVDREAQARQEYLEALTRALDGRLARDNRWVVDTVQDAVERHAVSTMGWGFEGLVCTLAQCTASWVPYAPQRPVQGFHRHAGVEATAVSMDDRGGNLTAVIATEPVPRQHVTQADLEQLPRRAEVQADWWDFTQVMAMRLPGLEIETQRRTSGIGPAEVPPGVVQVEESVLRAGGSGMERLARFVANLDQTPVRVRQITFAPNADGLGGHRWSLEMSYVAQR